MDWTAIGIIGVLSLLGIWWQFFLISKRDGDGHGPRRVIPAVFAGLVVFLGVTVWSIIGVIDENKALSVPDALWMDFKALIFGFSLCIKSYLGPVVLAFTLSFVTYHYFEYGVFKTVPFIQSVLGWAFSKTPEWLSTAYLICVCVYSLGASSFDSWSD